MKILNKIDNFLNEANIIQEPKFIKSVEKYIENNDWKDLDYVLKNINKIPDMFKTGDTLYRGMGFTEEQYDILIRDGYKLDKPTSWTTDKKIAESFLIDMKFRTRNTESVKKIIFKKVFTKKEIIINIFNYMLFTYNSGADIDELVMDSVKKEKEVLIKPILLTKKDIYREL